ncbi:MAG: phosphoribosyltransferase [Patescibacteria group bacterium]
MRETPQKFFDYEKRYQLLGPTKVPLGAFVKDTLPFLGRNGEIVYKKALTLKREWSSADYQAMTKGRTQFQKEDYQIVIIPPRNPTSENKDFTEDFLKKLKDNKSGKYPVATLSRQDYKGDTGDQGRNIIGRKKVRTVYIVASIVDDHDLVDVLHVAHKYKEYGEDVEINLIAPFIKGERDDKTVEITGKEKVKKHTGKIPSIAVTMQALSPFINNIYTYETHSSAAQAFSAVYGMRLIPVSLQNELIGAFLNSQKAFDPNDWLEVRPDFGRTMVARRICDILKMKGVSLSKFRKGDTIESSSNPLTEDEIRLLSGHNVLLYDDEAATFGTVADITLNHLLKANVKSINILLGHGRLQRGWDKNLEIMIKTCNEKNIPLKIFITNSRVPINTSDLSGFIKNHHGKIEIVSIAQKNIDLIEAITKGVDLFHDYYWERSILQAIDGYDNKKK